MRLQDVALTPSADPVPRDVLKFIREADRRVEVFCDRTRVPAFVACDFEAAYRTLRALAGSTTPRGPRFCEWGSGMGAVTCLAAFAGFEACGIEIAAELVLEARELADDFGLNVEFAAGSYVPPGGEYHVLAAGNYSWMTTESDFAYEELGVEPSDLDVVFAYPWPDEESITADLFLRYAGTGAVLATCQGGNDYRVRRKVGKPRRGRHR